MRGWAPEVIDAVGGRQPNPDVEVSDSDGNVTLSGTVRSYAEKQEAVRSAWLSPGVISVDDQLVITN